MKVFYSGDEVDFKAAAVALGNFDGLHIAHMKIINSCVEFAKKHNTKSGVLLFDHHSAQTTHSRNISLIMPNNYKIDILKDTGVDFIYFVKFDEEFMKKTPEQFILFLKEYLKAKCICVGYDYRFGYKAQGNTKMLYELGEKYDISINVTEKVTLDGELVGSTYIRTIINDGDMQKAMKFLGRPFFVEGFVERGLQNGRKMGFPTANVKFEKDIILPPDGVYAGVTYVKGKKYKSVINIGNNPTFNAQRKTVETHLLDFDEDIYNESVKVDLIERLRGEIKFENMEQLKNQISSDAEHTRNLKLF